MTKFCKDCKYHIMATEVVPLYCFPYIGAYEEHGCVYGFEPARHDPVTGEALRPLHARCRTRRLIGEDCGPEAKWFEPKETTEERDLANQRASYAIGTWVG